MKFPSSDRSPILLGLLVAGAWVVAHLVIQLPRGWPFYGPGEWDVLLAAQALADGEAPHVMVAALHGHELGVYVVILPVAILLALGVEMALAAKITAMLFGACTVGLAAGLAASVARHLRGTGGWLAGALTGCVLVVSWPDWHALAANLDGSTRHAVLPQLGAVGCMLAAWRRDSLRWSVGSGVLAAVAWFISAVSLWTLFLALGSCLLIASKHGAARGLRHGAVVVGGVVAWALLYGLVLPGGFTGVKVFAMAHPSWIGPVFSGADGPPADRVVAVGFVELSKHVSAGLLGQGGHAPNRAVRVALGLLSWSVLLFAAGRSVRALIRRRFDGLDLLALASASWLLPLGYLPETYRFYPGAYRFWAVPLCLGAAALAVQAEVLYARAGERRPVQLLLPLLLAGTAVVSLPNVKTSVDFPDRTLMEGMVHAGMHRMGRRAVGIHTTFQALRPHAPVGARSGLDQGYGLAFGFEVAEELHPEWEADDGWVELAETMELESRRGILVGVGCGLGASLPSEISPKPVVALFAAPDRGYLLAGLVRCALRQEDLGGSGDRSVLLDQLALEESDWHWVSRALETGGATPSQRSAWIPASVRSTVGSRLDRSALTVGEDVLGEVFDSYPVGAPP